MARPRAARTLALLAVLSSAIFAACLGPDGSGPGGTATASTTPPPTATTAPPTPAFGAGDLPEGFVNPFEFPLSYNGSRAHADALTQLFRDPGGLSDPLFRIPGSEDTETAAARILEAGRAAGYVGEWLNFTGREYYALDPGGVSSWQCDAGAPERERVEELEFHNVLLSPPGEPSGLLLLEHYDSKQHASYGDDEGKPIPGANDGASGVGSLLELARVLAGEGHTFLFVDGEDGFEDCHPLAGSVWFARLQPDGRGVTAALLLDMVGDPEGRYTKEGTSRTTPGGRGMQDALWAVASQMNASNFIQRVTSGVTDDHVPFIEEGIPAVDIIDWDPNRGHGRGHPFPPYWHTTADDHTVITPEGFARVGLVVEAYLRLDTWRGDAGVA